jgi:hypothetical protein
MFLAFTHFMGGDLKVFGEFARDTAEDFSKFFRRG